jgi:hypothetical protein
MPNTRSGGAASGGRRPRPKKLTAQAIAGEKGINLIERIVLGMRSRWSPTVGPDVGIDGTIELCDQGTGAALGMVLLVQSKVVSGRFTAESEHMFEYQCDERDVDYWLQGNAPVILIVSRPDKDEAYWIAAKEYFRDPAARVNARVRFDKRDDRFDMGAYASLLKAASPRASGVYLAPPVKREELISNLLAVHSTAPRIYMGQAMVGKAEGIWSALRESGGDSPAEWVLRSDRLISFNDLTTPVWRHICDRGSVEGFDATEWSLTDDHDRRREFVWLLNTCLRRKLYPRVRFRQDIDCYLFRPSLDMGPDAVAYERPGGSSSHRTVFSVHRNPKTGDVSYYKHAACEMQFRRFDGCWHLELNPTYVYTSDGDQLHRKQSELLAGIKRLDRNPAVLGQVLMWSDVVRRSGTSEAGPYQFLTFGALAPFGVEAGIDDKAWGSREFDGEEEVP